MDDRQSNRLVKLSDSGLMPSDPAEDIRGRVVIDRDGENIGKVVDLLLDEDDKKVRMVCIEEGGILGIGATPSYLPVDAITSISEAEIHVDQDRGQVAGAPRYDPDLVDESEFYTDLYEHYGYPPYWVPGYVYPGFPFTAPRR